MIKTAISLSAPAKINWSLSVTGRREDGYHQLMALNSAISLADTVTQRRAAEDSCVCVPPLPEESSGDNLALRAWRLLKREFSLPGGLAIEIRKRIFIAGGLGGGSADAAAVLHGVNRLYDLGQSREKLAALGLKLGADLPYCVHGSLAVVSGIGEYVEPLNPGKTLHLALVNPGFPVSTAEVYRCFRPRRDHEPPDMRALATAVQAGDLDAIAAYAVNDLEEAAFSLYPQLAALKRRCLSFNRTAMMSGSGGSMWILAQTAEEAAAITDILGREYPLTAFAHTL